MFMLRLGVIGLGYWGPNIVRNAARCPTMQLAALCDLDARRLEELGAQYPSARQYTEPGDLLADDEIDAIAIATPVASHLELARGALEAGKHVLVEKPFTSSSSDAEELLAIAAAADRVLMVDHVFLYSPAVRKLGELCASGQLGDLLFIDSVRINLGMFQHDVNVLWDLAPHDLSIIDYLLGRSPRGVVATGRSHAGNGLADVAYLHLDFGDELLASVHVNWLSPVKIRHFLVGGNRRSVLYNDLDLSEPIKVYDRGIDLSQDPEGRREVLISYRSGDVLCPTVDKSEPILNLIEHFADCVERGAQPISSGQQALRIVRVLEAADTSLSKGGAYVEVVGA
jgi:predicted dehydrogenase